MSRKKVNVCKVVLKDVGVALNRAEKFIAERTDEICFHEKLSLEVVIYFVYLGSYDFYLLGSKY